jgi:hypothetical protein
MDKNSAIAATLGMFFLFAIIVAGLEARERGTRSPLERAADACATVCGTHLVARMTVNECLCRESAE